MRIIWHPFLHSINLKFYTGVDSNTIRLLCVFYEIWSNTSWSIIPKSTKICYVNSGVVLIAHTSSTSKDIANLIWYLKRSRVGHFQRMELFFRYLQSFTPKNDVKVDQYFTLGVNMCEIVHRPNTKLYFFHPLLFMGVEAERLGMVILEYSWIINEVMNN